MPMLKLPIWASRLLPWTGPYLTAVIAAISAANPELARSWYSHSAYYLMWLLVWVWGLSTVNLISSTGWSPAVWIRKHWTGIAAALVLTGLVGVAVPATLRILSDEANVIAVSKSMVFEKRADNVTHGYRFFMNFFSLDGTRGGVEKHGLLFPFGVHIVHAFTGYRVENAYAFNLLVLLGLLIVAYAIIERRYGKLWGITASLLTAASPVVPLVARSGGVDLLAALVFVGFLCAVRIYVRRRDDAALGFLVSTMALMIHGRQEYVLAGVLGLGLLWAFGQLDPRKVFVGYLPTRLLAFTALPVVWQRLLVSDPFENAAHEAPFSAAHFAKNTWLFIKQYGDLNYFIPFSPAILIAGTAGLAYAVWRFVRRRPALWPMRGMSPDQAGWIAVGAALAIEWVVLASYFRGIPNHPSDVRYFTLYTIVLALLMTDLLARWFPKMPVRAGLGLALTLFLVYLPIAVDGRFINSQLAVRYHAFTIEYLQANAHKNSLIVSSRPGHYAIYGYGSVGIGWANAQRGIILDFLRQHAVKDIYVIQQLDPKKNMEPDESEKLHEDYVLEPVALMQNTKDEVIRISKVVVDNTELNLPMGMQNYRPVISPFPGVKGVVGFPKFKPVSFDEPQSPAPPALPAAVPVPAEPSVQTQSD